MECNEVNRTTPPEIGAADDPVFILDTCPTQVAAMHIGELRLVFNHFTILLSSLKSLKLTFGVSLSIVSVGP